MISYFYDIVLFYIMNSKTDVYLRFITLSWMIFGSLIWGIFAATDYNIVSRIARNIGIPKISRVIYGTIGVAAIIFYFRYFNDIVINNVQGNNTIPISLIKQSYPVNYNMTKELIVPDKVKYIIYWSSDNDITNVGSMEVGDNNKLKIRFREPMDKQKNIHYRWLNDKGQMTSTHTLVL